MIPIQLTVQGFLSYREPVELDFTSFELACISGPNGAGKSSLLDAITWVLFGQARRRDDALINNQSDAAEVRLTFTYEGNIYRVLRTKPRGKTTLLEFHILQERPEDISEILLGEGTWKPLTERTLRETQARIEQTLRLDYDTFINASFFLQGKADQFTQQRSGDRKRILSSILGLEIWETYRKRTVERRKKIEQELARLDGQLQEINEELAEEDTRTARLRELQDDLERVAQLRTVQEAQLINIRALHNTINSQRQMAAALARQVSSQTVNRGDLLDRAAARQAERDSYAELIARSGEIQTAHDSWQASLQELEQWEAIAGEFQEGEKRRQAPLDIINAAEARLHQEGETLTKQAQTLAEQDVYRKTAQEQLAEIELELKEIEAKLASRAELDQLLQTARARQAEAKAENPRLKSEMNEIKARINQISAVEGASCPICGQTLTQTDRERMIAELTEQGQELGDRYRANQKLLADSAQEVEELERDIQELSQADAALRSQTQHAAQLKAQIDQVNLKQAEWEQIGLRRLAEIELQLEAGTYAAEARTVLAEIDQELKTIGYDAAKHDEIRRTERNQRGPGAELHDLEKAQAALAPLERELDDMHVQIEALENSLRKLESEHTQAAAELAASEAQLPDLQTAERELLTLQEHENKLRMAVGAAQQNVNILDGLKTRHQSLEIERAALALRIGQHQQLERAFGKDGVPALLIEQALPEIEIKANDILGRLSEGSMAVRFITQAAYKDARREDLRETLDIQISDSVGTRAYEMYSGGEAFRVNFAIRLSLAEVLAQRAGARLQTLVIDEGFGSQDALGRQRLVEAINLISPDFAKILVITHIDELKEAFPTRIEVEKTPRGSTIRLM
jgi:exonuclease SbcC